MELFAKMDVKAIQNGLIQKVGGVKHFSVLAAIASFANDKGEAFPSQDKLAEMVGYSRKTVNQYVGQLRKVEIEGQPILRVIQKPTAKGRKNMYLISSSSGFQFGASKVTIPTDNVTKQESSNVTPSGSSNVTTGLQELELGELELREREPKDIVFDNAKAVLVYFREQYFNKYNVAYQTNWGRDQAMLKNKLMANFTDRDIKTIINIVVRDYETRWANPKFPRPTIGQLCTWLPNEALAVASKEKNETARIVNEEKKYEMNDDDFDRLLNEL